MIPVLQHGVFVSDIIINNIHMGSKRTELCLWWTFIKYNCLTSCCGTTGWTSQNQRKSSSQVSSGSCVGANQVNSLIQSVYSKLPFTACVSSLKGIIFNNNNNTRSTGPQLLLSFIFICAFVHPLSVKASTICCSERRAHLSEIG